MRILYVDDHVDTTFLMHKILSGLGHIADTATSLQSAKRLCQSNRYDLVMVDWELPDGDGLQLLKSIRKNGRTHGMVISGYGSKADIQRTVDAGFDMHLIKPVTSEQIRAAIATFETLSRTAPVNWVPVREFMMR